MDFKVFPRFVVFWICCAPFSISAQQAEIVSRQYTMKDGLPEEGVSCVIQDSHGFMWLGTYSGLCKFDGYTFTTYKNNPASSNSLKNNYVYSVLEDKKGRLWVAHAQGVDVFDPKTEKFYLHWPDSNNLTFRLRERKDGKIWLCSGSGVYVADPENLSIKKFPQLFGANDVAETNDGSVVSVSNVGVFIVDGKTGVMTHYRYDPLSPKSTPPFCWSVKVDTQNRIWIGTVDGLQLFNPIEKSFTFYTSNYSVIDILEHPDGKLWLGCGDGLYTFDPESRKVDQLTRNTFNQTVMRDKQGIVWVTSMQGLQQFHNKAKKFKTLRQFGQVIGTMAEDANNEVWILGSPNHNVVSSLFRYNPFSGRTQTYGQYYSADSRIYCTDSIRSLFRDNQGRVWVASEWRLEKYNVENRRFNVSNKVDVLINPLTSFMDSHGTAWFGSWGGVVRFDPVKGKAEFRDIAGWNVYSFLEDSGQNLWVGSAAGLSRYNLKTGKVDIFKNNPNDPQSLSSNTIYNLAMDSDKTIWVGTGGGLNKMIKGTENDIPRFQSWRATESGLPNDDVYCIVDGGDGTLWMTCGNMISHFSPKLNSFRNYDDNDGLSGRNFRGLFNQNGKGLRNHNGTIFFGGSDGVVVFHPDSLQNNSFKPPVTITAFSIRNKAIPIEGTHADTTTQQTLLAQSISYTDEIHLTFDQNDFNFEFSSLSFVDPEANQYKYKLEPYEKEWIETNANNRFARYTNISPGKYEFHVIGSNNDGVWNETGATLIIVVAPPWWETWWAYTVYGMALAALLFVLRRNIIHRERLSAKLELEHLELTKVQEVDKVKTDFFANISHEFRTPITLILGPLKEIYDGRFKGDLRPTLALVMRNGRRLQQLINQLLDFSKLEAGKLKLHASQSDLVQFLREMAASYESMAAHKRIKFSFYTEVPELMVYMDEEKMEKVVHNFLSNAFKFTNEDGEVTLNVTADEQWVSINIKDTGIGIPMDQIDKVFDRFYQVDSSLTRKFEGSGLGMALAKELVQLHHGRVTVESMEGSGTVFTLWLPLGNKHLQDDEIVDLIDLKDSKIIPEELLSMSNGFMTENGNGKEIHSEDRLPMLLIVEDNSDMRNYIRKMFSDQYRIIEAENGKAGVACAEESVPDLIISDIMMPEMDGYKLCELIKSKELTSHIPVVLLTSKADRESKLSGLETGADDYLSKPFDADELRLIVRNRIEQRKKMRERFSREITLEPKQIAITSFDEKFLTRVLAIIEGHMDDESFSIDELSREAGYSNMHFYRKIKALAGQTPSHFLRTIRLKRAAELLSKKSDNVTQIAYSVGFSSLSYFNKCFKEQFGITPGQYAESMHQAKN